MPKLNRRDFIKIAGISPLAISAPNLYKPFRQQANKKNVIIVVFDALSAYNMSLYGYDRQTTPNITVLAERALVYHNHYSSSNYTTSGTASLLTGTYPWTHRALSPNSTVVGDYKNQNIFTTFNNYYRIAYSHNPWVNTLFEDFKDNIEEFIPREQLTLFSIDKFIQKIFSNDSDIASVSWSRNIKSQQDDSTSSTYSLILSHVLNYFEKRYNFEYASQFPRGIPTSGADSGFLLEHSIDWVVKRIQEADDPVFGYFHFFPPHDPYRTRDEFIGIFRKDGFTTKDKPIDIFANAQNKPIRTKRQYYDEFILYVDSEFKRMYDMLGKTGKLDNTIIVLTSDHGEMFERGIAGHITSALYEPLIRIPLLIFEPGRTTREDIYEPTNAVDLLPTLAHLTGQQMPKWSEGQVLHPFNQFNEPANRNIFSVLSYNTKMTQAMLQTSVALINERYKLHYYFGYPQNNGKEKKLLFDVLKDPDELDDLFDSKKEIADVMLSELKESLTKAEKPYL